MRTMRDFLWFAFLFGLPAVVVVVGIRYLAHRQKGQPRVQEQVLAPETLKAHAPPAVKTETPLSENAGVPPPAPAPVEVSKSTVETYSAVKGEKSKEQTPGWAAMNKLLENCETAEYGVESTDLKSFTPTESQEMSHIFEDVKKRYQKWFKSMKKRIPKATLETLQRKIASIQLQLPPHVVDPDLNWRGVGIWVQANEGDSSQIRLGGGFKKFIQFRRLGRAKFELARVMAQGISHCELEEAKRHLLWQPLLECLGVEENVHCQEGSYSEAGWATSTAIAFQVSPLLCNIPGLVDKKVGSCLKKFPLPKLDQPMEKAAPHSAKAGGENG